MRGPARLDLHHRRHEGGLEGVLLRPLQDLGRPRLHTGSERRGQGSRGEVRSRQNQPALLNRLPTGAKRGIRPCPRQGQEEREDPWYCSNGGRKPRGQPPGNGLEHQGAAMRRRGRRRVEHNYRR
jgi:hypothetical protein